MNKKLLIGVAVFIAAITVILMSTSGGNETKSSGEHEATAEEFERGPHHGRMLRDGDFAIEVTIFEDNVPPEFRVYIYEDDKPVVPKDAQLSVNLVRVDGEVNQFAFAPVKDYLKGNATVVEPHSFDVQVNATYDGKAHKWEYASYEGRTTIPAEIAKQSGIETEKAGPATIEEKVNLSGKIVLNGNTTANIRARFPGIVREVKKGLGDIVEQGDLLATIESNDSLQVYKVTSPIKGVVLARNTNVGDVAGEAPLFKVADLSTVWAELHVFPADMNKIQIGQKVEVISLEGTQKSEGKIASLLPIAEDATQTIVARIPLENTNGAWRAGMTVQGKATIAAHEVPLAVKTSGIQRFRDFTVVFAQVGDTYEVRMLELGKDDGTHVEVLEGIKLGQSYVSGNSFLIRADIEKSGASHDH